MSTASQMKPLGFATGANTKGEYAQQTETGPAGRTVKPAAGENPKSAMIDGPFGGKKPA